MTLEMDMHTVVSVQLNGDTATASKVKKQAVQKDFFVGGVSLICQQC